MSIAVEDVMAKEVVTVNAEYSVKYAAKMMSYFGISSLLVLNGNDIDGILTERDVLTRIVAKGINAEKVQVQEIMTRPVMVVRPTTPLIDAVKMMLERKIKKLPVVEKISNRSKLIGILSLTDVARLQPLLMETLKSMAEIPQSAPEQQVGFYVS